MALKKGWKINYERNIPVIYGADVTEGQVVKWSAEGAVAVCGAGEMPAGVAPTTLDISEVGAEGEIVTDQIAVVPAAAEIASLLIPVMVGAAGTCTPVTADGDIVLGMPLNLDATVGADIQVDLKLMGSYYYKAP